VGGEGEAARDEEVRVEHAQEEGVVGWAIPVTDRQNVFLTKRAKAPHSHPRPHP
jgi:hypothetical protein